MSKKAKAVSLTEAVSIEGIYMSLCTDGNIHVADVKSPKGTDLSEYDVVITKEGLAAIKKSSVIMAQISKLQVSLSKIKTGKAGEYGPVLFTAEGDDEQPCVRVGCTTVWPDELPGYMKQLGIK